MTVSQLTWNDDNGVAQPMFTHFMTDVQAKARQQDVSHSQINNKFLTTAASNNTDLHRETENRAFYFYKCKFLNKRSAINF